LSPGEQVAGEKILNIDDSPTVQRLIEMILSSQGYQVVLASDGEAGIAKAKAEKPALILVDFVMPKMNGFQVCKTLKEDPEFQDTPIILVTSKGDKVGSKFVDVLGITEYFTKPFQPEELLAKIREVLDKKQTPALSAPETDLRQPAAPPATPPLSAQTMPPGLENMVRQLIEQALDGFIKQSLPELIRRELAKAPPATQAGIQGNLSSFRIIEVMQMLGLQRQTGRLALSRGGEGVDIYFRDGAVVYASSACDGGNLDVEGLLKKACRLEDDGIQHVLRIAEMTGQPIDTILAQEKMVDPRAFADNLMRHTESAVYKTMAWRDGDFFFEKTTPPVFATPLQLKVDDLLLEGARRADEWALIQQKIPNFDIVFEPMIGNAEELTTRGMSDIDLKVFSLIDGKHTIQDILDVSCLSEFDVAKSMFILLSVNLIRKKSKTSEGAPRTRRN
jgi:CheY-like chemotaxis protein